MDNSCWKHFKNFKAEEFACGCGCGNKDMDCNMLYILQAIRDKYGRVDVTSGNRCQKYNDSLDGSIKNSDHIGGYAADIKVISKMSNLAGRVEVMLFASQLPGFKYAYCNGKMIKDGKVSSYKASWMGKAIHISIRRP